MASFDSTHRPARLSERLAQSRKRRFVGRQSELELFRSVLLQTELPFNLLHLFGPGGIGKTSLLHQYAQLAEEQGVPCFLLESRNIDLSKSGFLLALQAALGLDGILSEDSICEALAEFERSVLLIDTYELLQPLDSWLRETILPQFHSQCLVVIAGRNPPNPAWYTDLGWQELVRVVSLRNFAPEESQNYLEQRGLAPEQFEQVLKFTHGHPLALSLIADLLAQSGTTPKAAFNPEHEPDIIRVLLERFLEQVPTPLHRRALEICSLTRTTTEASLSYLLEDEKAPQLFAWLRTLSFIEQSSDGLFPHNLVREVIEADLRWRNPQKYRLLFRKAREYLREARKADTLELQTFRVELFYLLRNAPYFKRYLDWKSLGDAYAETATPLDFPQIIATVKKYEGNRSAGIAQHWLNRQPHAFIVFRNSENELIGFMTNLALHQATPEDLEVDPGAKAVMNYIHTKMPLSPSDEVFHHRFWMGRDTYQKVASALNMTVLGTTRLWETNRKLAWSFISFAEPEFWQAHFSYINFWLAEEAAFEIGGRRYGTYGHDWRKEPFPVWRDIVEERDFSTETELEPLLASKELTLSVLALSQAEFAEACRLALRNYTRPAVLLESPLLRSGLLANQQVSQTRIFTLQKLIREAAESLKTNPKDEKLYRALWRTYFEPAASQELAAESLSLPFSTYRSHLTAGIERVIAWLWQREMYGLTN